MQLTDQILAYHRKLAGHAPTTKFHRAAIDNYVDMLCEATRRDTNQFSHEEGLTPTLLAAQQGNLEALRIIVGRGGDPELAGPSGGCALHLAAARGHLSCVSFLVNFGVNMWALDNELRTAKDLAAIEQHKGVLDFLDQMMAKQSALNTRNVQKLKEKAKMSAERRLKLLRKAQLKAIKQAEKDERRLAKLSNGRRILRAAHSISDIKLVGRQPTGLTSQINYSLDGRSPARTTGSGSVYSSSSSSTGSSSLASSLSSTDHSFMQISRSSVTSRLQLQSSNCFAKIHERAALISAMENSAGQLLKRPDHVDRKSLEPVARRTTSHSPAPSSSGSSSNKNQAARPKYSDLVAVKEAELAARAQSAASMAQEKLRRNLPLVLGLAAAAETVRPLIQQQQQRQPAQHLVRSPRSMWNIAPVSRKVNNSRSQLLVAQSTCDVSSSIRELPKKSGLTLDRVEDSALSRATSEPNFAAAIESSDNQPKDNKLDKPIEDERDQTQHELLTKCLSQLKLRHEAIHGRQQTDTRSDTRAAKVTSQNSIVPSDELLQHQLTAGSNPLRPSVIKQQQKSQQILLKDHQRFEQHQESRSVGSDSIGSAGSLTRREISTENSAASVASETVDLPSADYKSRQDMKCAQVSTDDANSLNMFLQSIGLVELVPVLTREKIDLDSLVLITEEDLKSLNILMGPRRKLLNAIDTRLRLSHSAKSNVVPEIRIDDGDPPNEESTNKTTTEPVVIDTYL